MLMRVFQVTVHAGQEIAFRAFFEHTALPLMQQQAGLISINGGGARPETLQEFCLVMVWRDLEALRAFVGEDRLEAHVHPDEAEPVATRQLSHYAVIGARGRATAVSVHLRSLQPL